MAIDLQSDQAQDFEEQLDNASAEQQGGQQRLERGMDIGVVDAITLAKLGTVVGGSGGQCLQVVAQDFGGYVLLDSVLRQA